MNPLRRLLHWWRDHRPVIVARRTTRDLEAIIHTLHQQQFIDQMNIKLLTMQAENLQAQHASQRTLLAAHEREQRRMQGQHDEAIDEINRLLEENRHLRQDNNYHHEAARMWITIHREPTIYHN